jgi:catalase (peroxidase I)
MLAALIADGFRNYVHAGHRKPRRLLVERANMLTLTAPEMTGASWRHACPECER